MLKLLQIKVWLIIPISILLSSCFLGYVGGNEGVYIEPSELLKMQKEGNNGDLEAIHKLINYYFYYEPAVNVESQNYWLDMAAKYGDLESQVTLGYRLMESDSDFHATKESCYKGVALIKDAAQKGNILANSKLTKLPNCDSFKPAQ